jgi:hypothetical protein
MRGVDAADTYTLRVAAEVQLLAAPIFIHRGETSPVSELLKRGVEGADTYTLRVLLAPSSH